MFVQFEEVAARDDLMGVEDTAKKDILLCKYCCSQMVLFPTVVYYLMVRVTLVVVAKVKGH